jgi:SPP1 family predicted phage head-tail adaptor
MSTLSQELNLRITLQVPVKGKDAEGGNVKTWAPWIAEGDGKIFANMNNLSGNEKRATTHGGEVSVPRTEFKIRYRPGVTTAMRVLFGGMVYNISHVNNVRQANKIIILTCDTGTKNG